MNGKINETIIANTNCLVLKINKNNYHDLAKEYLSRAKNKFLNLIFTYKIFNNILHDNFELKYYRFFKYIKVYNKQSLFEEGDICDNVYFISKGEYEIYLYQNINKINNIILRLKNLIDDLKIKIINERKKDNEIYPNFKSKSFQFFKQFDKINLEKLAYNIKNDEINMKKRSDFDKSFFNKRNIKIGILKSRQIIGLNDIINRNLGNVCLFNCVCTSYEGELYYIPYNKFLSIYRSESKVKLSTYELLYQNIYYLIQRLLFQKQVIIKKESEKENEEEKIYLKGIETDRQPKNKIISKIKFNFNKITNDIRNEEKNFTTHNYSKTSLKNSETKIKNIFPYKRINIVKSQKILNKEIIKHNLSEKKYSGNVSTDESNKIKGTLKNIFSKRTIKSANYKNLKFNFVNSNLKKFSQTSLFSKKGKSDTMKTPDINNNYERPILVINDNEVKVNENNYADNTFYRKPNYDIYMNYYLNEKNVDLTNNKELRNIILFGNYNEKIEEKKNYRLFQKSKNLILKRIHKQKLFTNDTQKKLDDTKIFNLKLAPLFSVNKHANTICRNSCFNNSENYKSRNRNIFRKEQKNLNKSDKNLTIKRMKYNSKVEFCRNSKNDFIINHKSIHNNKTIKNIYFNNSYLQKNLSDIKFIHIIKAKDKTIQNSDLKNKSYFDLLNNNDKKKNKFTTKSDTFSKSLLIEKGIGKK